MGKGEGRGNGERCMNDQLLAKLTRECSTVVEKKNVQRRSASIAEALPKAEGGRGKWYMVDDHG